MCPVNSPRIANRNGALWCSGAVTSCVAAAGMYGAVGAVGSTVAGVPEKMTFGRPVLPPDTGAFHDDACTSGSSPPPSDGSMTSNRRTPGSVASSKPTTSAGSVSSTIARSSSGSVLGDNACGVAPAFHTAAQSTTNSIVLAMPIVTTSSTVTPSSISRRATASDRRCSSPRVIEPVVSCTATASGS